MPLRIYTADNVLIGEFGEERRSVLRIQDFPPQMKQALLAAEDDRFYDHPGIDITGIARAFLSNITSGGTRLQGASTITQQVARNFFLTNERQYTRKVYEVLLAFKIEASLSKDQILELYMNQIYLGQRSFGFAQASQAYFGKNIRDITVAEAAMLAGIPKAPSAYNPVVNLRRATARQKYVLDRMRSLGYINDQQHEQALAQRLDIHPSAATYAVHGEYVAEMARQAAYDLWKDDAYVRGINVYTTITSADQNAAYAAVRSGVLDYDRRHGYRGPEAFVDLPDKITDEFIDDVIEKHPDADDLLTAVVLDAAPKRVRVARPGLEPIDIGETGLKFVAASLSDKAQPNRRIRRGAVVRVTRGSNGWEIVQQPEIESAFVAMNPMDGSVKALVGGFDFWRNKFNHVTQAWRQPGSGFKPFIYSAALERGFSPATVINDAPLVFDAGQTGSQPWEPKNYDGTYEGPMSMRRALTKSKNLVSIRILKTIGPRYAQDFISRFGFEADKHPPYLTMALGAGSVTPWQMAGGYSVFANGGFRTRPFVVAKMTDVNGRVLAEAKPLLAGDEANRVLDERNAFIMDSMLRDVVRYGTAASAMKLKRTDLAGKTGTTNDSVDAWFNGYQPTLVGITWIGYDQPRSLGDRETGGGAALPIWIGFMGKALAGVPNIDRPVPAGVVSANGEYYYAERQPGEAIGTLSDDENKDANAVKSELF
ncbi:penicillin-binding protein 1A [Derxia lacustris]|uniref:penicillin-binding protein 1A n=1 Tax=Derxia lacustris TaxID=764842 RepID=UPI00111C0311|nr:penicillin-binding protein 1A [Derxia lacustris]